MSYLDDAPAAINPKCPVPPGPFWASNTESEGKTRNLAAALSFSSENEREGRRDGASRGGRERRVLRPILCRAQGEVRTRVPRVRVQARWQAPLRKQLQLQERHHDPQGGLALSRRPPRVPTHYRWQRGTSSSSLYVLWIFWQIRVLLGPVDSHHSFFFLIVLPLKMEMLLMSFRLL